MNFPDPTTLAFALALTMLGGCSLFKGHTPPASTSAANPVAAAPAPATPVPEYTDPALSEENTGSTIDEVVASVDGEPITSHDLTVSRATNSAGAGGGAGAPPMPDDPSAVLKQLITQKMLDAESAKYADKVDEAHVDHYIQGIEQQNHMTDDQLRAQLQTQGVSYDEFRQNVRRQVQVLTMIDREVRQKIVISDAQIEAFYKAHPDDFTATDEKYRLAQILIAVPQNATPDQVAAANAKAEVVRKKLAKGADFGSLAQLYSDDDSKAKGGELGYFSPNDLNDQVLAGIQNLKPGDVSGVIRTKYGFHIVMVEEHQRAGLQPLDQVKDQIREALMTQEARGEFQTWVDKDLVKQHFVETTY